MTPDPLLQELLDELITKLGPIIQAVDAFSAEHGYALPIGETEIILREILTSAVLRTRERVKGEMYDGIRRWAEMALKEGWVDHHQWYSDDELASSIKSYANGNDLTALKETNPSTP